MKIVVAFYSVLYQIEGFVFWYLLSVPISEFLRLNSQFRYSLLKYKKRKIYNGMQLMHA